MNRRLFSLRFREVRMRNQRGQLEGIMRMTVKGLLANQAICLAALKTLKKAMPSPSARQV